MDSNLASQLSTLSNNVSSLTTAVANFLKNQGGTPILTPAELTRVLSDLGTANTAITDVITQLTPASVTVSATPAPPSSN